MIEKTDLQINYLKIHQQRGLLNRHISINKIFTNDFIVFLCILFPIIIPLWYITSCEESPEVDPGTLITYGVIVILAIGCLFWRILLIKDIVENSLEVQAKLDDVSFNRAHGILQFTYNYLGQIMSGSNRVLRSKTSDQYSVGQDIVLLVDTNNPGRALVRDLYTKDES